MTTKASPVRRSKGPEWSTWPAVADEADYRLFFGERDTAGRGKPPAQSSTRHRVETFGSEYREMLLHCGPVRGRLLDDNYVATHRTRDLLHCEFGLYWVFGQDRNHVARNLQLFVRGLGQALQQCFQCRNHRAHDRIRRMAPGRRESVVSYLKDPRT